jgi:hypothetical protein
MFGDRNRLVFLYFLTPTYPFFAGSIQRIRSELFHKGFCYMKNHEFADTTNWHCSLFHRRKCKARAVSRIGWNGEILITLSSTQHNHPAANDHI